MTTTAELGTKHECPSCNTKYYDLGKADAPCPKCGASLDGEDADPEAKGSSKKS